MQDSRDVATFIHGHALLIGVDGIQNALASELPSASNDALALAQVLGDARFCGYPILQVTSLTAELTTRAAILSALEQLVERAGTESVVVVYYAGYGGYGTDNRYHLASYDSIFDQHHLVGGGVTLRDLLGQLDRLRARRVLLILNTRPAAEDLGPLGWANPPMALSAALMAGQAGRFVITACREEQRSLTGADQLTLFGAALADGLRGNGVADQRGYISIFDLYHAVYERVRATALKGYGQVQEPVLTAIEGARPFAVARYGSAAPAPEQAAQARDISRTAAYAIGASYSRTIFERLRRDDAAIGSRLDARGSQGFVYQPQGPVKQVFGTQISIEGATISMPQRLPSGARFAAPKLPDHFVMRPEISELLKRQLLAKHQSESDTLVVSAVRGLGGIGKSTLVAALARDPEVQQRFHDGILWATLGQQPDLLARLSAWVRTASGYDIRPTSVDAASEYLRGLLHDKRILLVIDDAWDASHVAPFLVGGPHCQAVITTRDALIAKAVQAPLFDVNVMTIDQALALLTGRLGHEIGAADREHALAIAEAVGYLPLALGLAAAQVAGGMPWPVLHEELASEIKRLEILELAGAQDISSEAIRKELSLPASFQLSVRRLPEANRRAFTWLGILPEDVLVVPTMAATLWDTSLTGAYKMLEYLYDKTLLLAGISRPDGTMLAYRLHDLLHDMARQLLVAPPVPQQPDKLPGLGLEPAAAHAGLLDRYRARARDGLLHTLPDDGYFHSNAAWHMEQAGRPDQLHALLHEETAQGRNGWYVVCNQLSQTATYLSTIERAWQLADRAGLQCRYALMVASLNSLAQNIPPSLLAALVAKKVWTPIQGLAYARQAPKAEQRASAMAELVPHLPEELRGQALATVEAIADEEQRRAGLLMLAAHMHEAQAPALAVARMAANEFERVMALAVLVPHLQSGERESALDLAQTSARAIADRIRRVDALLALAPYIRIDEQRSTLNEIFADARGIADEDRRSQALVALVRCSLSIGDVQQALTFVRDRDNLSEQQRAPLLIEIAAQLPAALQPEVLEIAQLFIDDVRRVTTLAALIPHLQADLRERTGMTTLAKAWRIDDSLARIRIFAALAAYLPHDVRDSTLQRALGTLEPNLVADDFKPQQGTTQLPKRDEQVAALAMLLPHLPTSQDQEVFVAILTTIQAMSDPLQQIQALAGIVPHIGDLGQLDRVLAFATAQSSKSQLDAILLSELVVRFLKLDRPKQALAVALIMPYEDQQATALESLAAHLDGVEDTQKVLAAVQQMQDGRRQTQVLAALAPILSGEMLERTLAIIQQIGDTESQHAAIKALTPAERERQKLTPATLLAPGDEPINAPTNGRNWADPGEMVFRLSAQNGAASQGAETLTLAAEQEDEEESELTIEQLALQQLPPLRGKALKQTIEAILDVGSEAEIAETLAALAQQLSEPLIRQALTAQERVGLSGWVVARLVPRLAELGYGQQALQAAQDIADQFWQTQALSAVTQQLPAMLLPQALVVGAPLQAVAERLQALGYPTHQDDQGRWHPPLALVVPAFEEAQKIDDEAWRTHILFLLAPTLAQLPRARLDSLWSAFLHVSAKRSRRDVLADIRALAPLIARLNGAEGMDEAARAISDVGRWWP